jgi:hypothetical protein
LEQFEVSWSRKKLSGVETLRFADKLKSFEDYDKDEEEARAISHRHRIRRESQLRENGLLKY